MSYVQKTLSKDEEIKLIVRPHWCNYLFSFCVIFLGVVSVLGYFANNPETDNALKMGVFFLVWGGYLFLRIYFMEMVATNKRVIYRKGLITRFTREIRNSKVESIEVKQGLLGLILGYGTIVFSGTGSSSMCFYFVKKPMEVRMQLENIINN